MSESNFLPRFSKKEDIDSFVEKLEAYERGELTAEQFRTFRLLRGVYGQRQPDIQMQRVKIPMGIVGTEQLETLADYADKFSRGYGHITTRQNVQFHFVKLSDTEEGMRLLHQAGLTTRDACGNSVRNVTACELAEVCSGAAFDVTPYAETIVRQFLGHPMSGDLPRKFKIAFSGCGSDCAYGAIHDIGFIAKVEDGQRGFKVVAAGGLSTTPQSAVTLHEFIPAGEINRVAEAIVRLFHALGNRDNKHRARMKYVLRKLGAPAFLAKYAELKAQVDAEALAEIKLPERPKATPHPPVVDAFASARLPGYLEWKSSSVVDQRQDGYAADVDRRELGDITPRQLRALGEIVKRFGDGTARLTIDQNILIPWVDAKSLPALFVALKEHDLAKTGIHTARDVTSCPGAETCNLAVTSSRQVAASIMEKLDAKEYDDLKALADTVIKVSGCPNSCGQHHIANIGWHGAAKTVGDTTYPVYQLHLGGDVDEKGARFGRQVVKVFAKRVPEAVVLLMKLYEAERAEGETPAKFFARVDPKRVTAQLEPVMGPPRPEDAADIGQTDGFQVAIGQGECAA